MYKFFAGTIGWCFLLSSAFGGPVKVGEHEDLKGKTYEPKSYVSFHDTDKEWGGVISSVHIDNDETIVLLGNNYELKDVNIVLFGKGTYNLRDFDWNDNVSSIFWVEKPRNPKDLINFVKTLTKPGPFDLKRFDFRATKPARDLAEFVRDQVALGNEREAKWEELVFDRETGEFRGNMRVRHRQVSGKDIFGKPLVTYDLGTNGTFKISPSKPADFKLEVGIDKPKWLGGGQVKFNIAELAVLLGP